MTKPITLATLSVLLLTVGSLPVDLDGLAVENSRPVGTDRVEGAPARLCVSQFLDFGGGIDFDAVLGSGCEGWLDMDEFQFALEPTTGEPFARPASPAQTADHW